MTERFHGVLVVFTMSFGLGVGAAESAQESLGTAGAGFFFAPSIRVAGIYDDNLFFGSEGRVQAFYTRLAPTIAANYRTPRLQTSVMGSIDAEFFPNDLKELTGVTRKAVGARFSFASSPRTSFSLQASYVETLNAGEFLISSGQDLGRRPSRGFSGGANWSRRLTERQELHVAFAGGRAELERQVDETTQTAVYSIDTGWSYGFSQKTKFQLGYSIRAFGESGAISGLEGIRTSVSHVLTVGMEQQFTRRSSLALSGGPRLSSPSGETAVQIGSGSVLEAQADVTFRHERNRTDISLSYSRGQTPSFGVGGFVVTNSISVNFRYQLKERLTLGISPGAFQNDRGPDSVRSYRARLDLVAELMDWLHLTTQYSFSGQNGQFTVLPDGIGLDDRWIGRNTVSVSVAVGHLVLVR